MRSASPPKSKKKPEAKKRGWQDRRRSIEEARKLIKGWHKAHPGVGEFTERTLHEARQTGFVETLGLGKLLFLA